MSRKKKYVDDLGRVWPTDMGDITPGDTVWTGAVMAKIISFDPVMGSGSALYEWTTDDGVVKRHHGLPPLKSGCSWHAERAPK